MKKFAKLISISAMILATFAASATNIVFQWTASPSPTAVAYNFYDVTTTRTLIGSSTNTTFTATNQSITTPRSYTVTATDSWGNESTNANIVTIGVPAAPTALIIVQVK